MEKDYLTGFMAYVINQHEDGYFLSDGNGFIIESEDLIEIGKNLISFAKKHKEDIIAHNEKARKNLYGFYEKLKKEPKKRSGHIYIMECGGKYKIGLSKNVERRKKQLDHRPFPVEIIYKSPELENVIDYERELHEVFDDKRISGEWFDLDEKDIDIIKNHLELAKQEEEQK